jgi:hypothetical protein
MSSSKAFKNKRPSCNCSYILNILSPHHSVCSRLLITLQRGRCTVEQGQLTLSAEAKVKGARRSDSENGAIDEW